MVNVNVNPHNAPPAKSASAVEMEEEDAFYQKLNNLNQSSGLSLLFNFRDTSIDLHQLYKIVTQRGGYQQVSKDEKWEEVSSGLNQQNRLTLTPTQFQKLYATILHPLEQTYQYQNCVKPPITPPGSLDSESKNILGKRKLDDTTNQSSPVAKVEEKKPVLKLAKVKETRKDPRAPLRSRNCYQMFIKIECDRLKRMHGDIPSARHLGLVVEAWRRLSDDDKRPYMEASKRDKERFAREMAAYKRSKKVMDFSITNTASDSHNAGPGNQKVVDFGKPESDDEYHVKLQPDEEEDAEIPDESMVEKTVGLMKNAPPNDPIFQINWDDYCG